MTAKFLLPQNYFYLIIYYYNFTLDEILKYAVLYNFFMRNIIILHYIDTQNDNIVVGN